jgi:hypothetical protein
MDVGAKGLAEGLMGARESYFGIFGSAFPIE